MTTQTFSVVGMSCDHCVGAVTHEVGRLAGAEQVSVELSTGLVSVTSADGLDPAAVAAAVDEAGYEVVP